MKLFDLGFLLLLVSSVAVGVVSYLVSKKPDGAIEEKAEEVIEGVTEKELHLPDGSLKGKVDLTPFSPEKVA